MEHQNDSHNSSSSDNSAPSFNGLDMHSENHGPSAPLPASTHKVLQPADPTLERSTINVGRPLVPPQPNHSPPMPSAAPTPPVAPPASHFAAPAMTPIPPTPAIPSSLPPEPEWKPAPRNLAASPFANLVFSLLSVFAAFIFLTWGVGINIWVKAVALLFLSGAGLFFTLKAYLNEDRSLTIVSLIISTTMLLATVLGGSTYLYYYIKFKQLESSFKNGSSSKTYNSNNYSSSNSYGN